MADNTILDPGTGGDTIATDDIAGVKHQRVKIEFGADGSATDVSTANPLPISDAGGTLSVDDGASSLTVDGTVGLSAGTNNIGDVDVLTLPGTAADGGALPATTVVISGYDGANVQVLKTDNAGILAVSDGGSTISIDDGAGSLTVDGSVSVTGTSSVNVKPATSGGLSISRTLSAASTNATSVKGSAGQVFGWFLYNANASARYLKLYNKASAPTVGTDTPVMTIPIPGASAANIEFTNGIAFGTGIALALTTGIADADTGAVAANDLAINLLYA